MAEAPKPPARRRRPRRSAVEWVRNTDFAVAMRGYDRQAVDRYVADVAQLVAELEATQTREGVVQRALDEVGEQTSGILQHAHDTAEEIASRSRSQAEGRLQRAEQEAEQTRQEADDYARRVVEDTKRLWQQRQRLIEDMRQLADEVLGTADDALERLELPDIRVGAREEPEAELEVEPELAGEGVVAAGEPPQPDAEPTVAWEAQTEEDEPEVVDSGAVEENEQSTSEFETPATEKREAR
jgi:DivIVA domain-containing protein